MIRLLLTLFALLIVLAAGGGAAWWFLYQDEEIDLSAITETSRAVPLFVDFDPLVLPVIRDGRVTQHLTFTIVLEVDRDYERLDIYKHMVRLKDAYLAELHALYSHRSVQDRVDVVPLLNKRLLAVSHRVLGPEIVKRVLIDVLEKHDMIIG
jgi:cyclic lactone autoinducer peptide